MQMTTFLKRVLLLDAASCFGLGALLIAGAAPLSAVFGLGTALLLTAGAALIPIALFILWVGTRARVRPLFAYLIVAGNLLWVLESLLLLRGATQITGLGTAFVAAQATAVAALAMLEWIGIRRARGEPAQA